MSSFSSLKLLNALSIRLQGLLDSENFHQSILNLLKSELSYEGIQFWSLPSGVSADARLDAVVGREEGLVELGQALSPREQLVVKLVAEGYSNKNISAILHLSVKTTEAHRSAAMRKLDLNSTAGLVRYAVRAKLVEA